MDMTIIGGFAALSIFDYFNFIFVMERCFFPCVLLQDRDNRSCGKVLQGWHEG